MRSSAGWLTVFGHAEPLAWFRGLAEFYNGLPTEPVNQFYFFRFMLGFFEGGFFPSVILYLSLWFRAADRAKAIASFMAAIPVATVFGLPVSGLLLNLNWSGWPGWRWIFILQGVLPIIAGVVTLFVLPNRPEDATWLRPDERESLLGDLQKEAWAKPGISTCAILLSHLGVVLLLTIVYFCLNVFSYGLSMFMPAIIKSQSGAGDVAGQRAGRRCRTSWRCWACCSTAGIRTAPGNASCMCPYRWRARVWAIAIAAATDGQWIFPVLAMILIVGPTYYAHLPAFWPIPTMFLGATAAASAIGFINMIGNLGGFVGTLHRGSVGRRARDLMRMHSTSWPHFRSWRPASY